jgi:Histone-binding protein RBBP4 or subunit C of CAF1 complex
MASGEHGGACKSGLQQVMCRSLAVPQKHDGMCEAMVQDKEEVDGRYSKQKMVLGTHTSEGEQNYLMLAEVQHCRRPHSDTAPAVLQCARWLGSTWR